MYNPDITELFNKRSSKDLELSKCMQNMIDVADIVLNHNIIPDKIPDCSILLKELDELDKEINLKVNDKDLYKLYQEVNSLIRKEEYELVSSKIEEINSYV